VFLFFLLLRTFFLFPLSTQARVPVLAGHAYLMKPNHAVLPDIVQRSIPLHFVLIVQRVVKQYRIAIKHARVDAQNPAVAAPANRTHTAHHGQVHAHVAAQRHAVAVIVNHVQPRLRHPPLCLLPPSLREQVVIYQLLFGVLTNAQMIFHINVQNIQLDGFGISARRAITLAPTQRQNAILKLENAVQIHHSSIVQPHIPHLKNGRERNYGVSLGDGEL
jgi:hypothetical protein